MTIELLHRILVQPEYTGDRDMNEAVKRSDESALSVLYNKYIHCLFNYGMHICQDRILVTACLEEFFKGFNNKPAPFTNIRSEKIYFFMSFRMLLNEKLRQRAVYPLRSDGASQKGSLALEKTAECKQTTNSTSVAAEQHVTLTIMQREAIVLKFCNNLTYQDVSVIMDLDMHSVQDLVMQGMNVLSAEQNHQPFR